MKHAKKLILVAFVFTLFVSCNDENSINISPPQEADLELSTNRVELASSGAPVEITFTTNQPSYSISSDQDWCVATQLGHKFSVSADEHTGETPRVANVTVTVGSGENVVSKTLEVTQVAPQLAPTINISGIELVLVKGGTFKMGAQNSDPQGDNYGVGDGGSHYKDNQSPVHNVTLPDYYIGKFEITQDQWTTVMGSNPSANVGEGKGNFPVEYVDWNMAQEFIEKLSEETGRTFRLPTEAEWEYAARGGEQSLGFLYSGSDDVSAVGNFVQNSSERDVNATVEVGSYAPNELGIYDMSGNLYEWCSDIYGDYSADDQVNPTGAESGGRYILRGGSWWHYKTTAYYRGSNTPDYTGGSPNAGLTGFRVVLEPVQ